MSTEPTYVYTDVTQQRCNRVMAWLTDQAVPFEERRVRDYPEDAERFHSMGLDKLPIVFPAGGSGLPPWAGLHMSGMGALRDYNAGALVH